MADGDFALLCVQYTSPCAKAGHVKGQGMAELTFGLHRIVPRTCLDPTLPSQPRGSRKAGKTGLPLLEAGASVSLAKLSCSNHSMACKGTKRPRVPAWQRSSGFWPVTQWSKLFDFKPWTPGMAVWPLRLL